MTIPDQVTVIEEGVFSGCENLVRIDIPETVTAIGARAFEYCFSLCQITMTGQCPECGAQETIIARKTATGHTFGKDGRCITCGNGPELVVEISNCDKIHWYPGDLEVYEDDVLLATMTAPKGTTVRKVFPYDSQKTYRFVWATWLYNEEGSFRIWLNGHLLKTGTGWDYMAGDEVLALDPGCKHEYTKGCCPFCEKSLLPGDANSDGSVNMGDVASIYAHIRCTKEITDADQLRCANVTGGAINLSDVARLFAHVTGRNKLY